MSTTTKNHFFNRLIYLGGSGHFEVVLLVQSTQLKFQLKIVRLC